MRQFFLILILLFSIFSCSEDLVENNTFTRILSLDDIKREYAIADSLNRLEDRSNMNTETILLGIDERNGQTIIRTCLNRGFGCLMFTDYQTILYLNCDSVCCETKGFWEVDYVGIAGQYSPVGCAPDTLSTEITNCGCSN